MPALPTPAGDRNLTLCGPAGMRLLVEVPWHAPVRLQVSGLVPAAPDGAGTLSPARVVPAIAVSRRRGVQALTTAIVCRLLPMYQPPLQAAQARAGVHCDTVARQDRSLQNEYRLQRESEVHQSVAWLDRFAVQVREHDIETLRQSVLSLVGVLCQILVGRGTGLAAALSHRATREDGP
jgi:hypothetical protein